MAREGAPLQGAQSPRRTPAERRRARAWARQSAERHIWRLHAYLDEVDATFDGYDDQVRRRLRLVALRVEVVAG